jgi:hypothetical protein
MATYVGKWDCPTCGTQRIPGWKDGRTVERCPTCNGPSTGKWYMDNRDMVVPAAELAGAKSKRAWKCGHCSHMNDAEDLYCDACGNPKDVSTDDQQLVSREYKPFQQPQSGEDVEAARMENLTDSPSKDTNAYSKSGRAQQSVFDAKMQIIRKRRWVVAGAGVAVIGLILLLLLWKKEVPVTVVGFSWERSIDIEFFGPVQESSWGSAPSGAYNVSSSEEIHHYNTIVIGRDCHTETTTEVCGTVDNGNGTFSDQYCTSNHEVCVDRTREEPVYETRYYYTIDRWHFDHTETVTAKDHNAYWPVFQQTRSSPSTWREGVKREKYAIHLLREKGIIQIQEVPAERWLRTKDRQQLIGYKNVVFGYWIGIEKEK